MWEFIKLYFEKIKILNRPPKRALISLVFFFLNLGKKVQMLSIKSKTLKICDSEDKLDYTIFFVVEKIASIQKGLAFCR